MRVRDCMTRNPIVVAPEDTLLHARSIMKRHGIRHLLVLSDGRLDGVITDRDIRDYMPSVCRDRSLHELTSEISRLEVDEVMRRLPVRVAPDVLVSEAVELMLHNRVGCLPVVEHGEVCGVLTTSDALRVLARTLGGPGTEPVHLTTGDEVPIG